MIATLLFHECPLIVMVTAGRLPPPSASTTSGGTSRPRMGSGGSTQDRNFIICSCQLVSARRAGAPRRPVHSSAASHANPAKARRCRAARGQRSTACPLLRVRLVLALGAVADVPDVAIRVGER